MLTLGPAMALFVVKDAAEARAFVEAWCDGCEKESHGGYGCPRKRDMYRQGQHENLVRDAAGIPTCAAFVRELGPDGMAIDRSAPDFGPLFQESQ